MNGTTATRRPLRRAYDQARLSSVVRFMGAVAILLVAVKLLATPALVGRITFENPTDHDVTVYVTGKKHDGWMPIGIVQKDTTFTFERVVDQGDVWILRFSATGDEIEVSRTRQQLRAADWRVQVPSSADDEAAPSSTGGKSASDSHVSGG